MDSVKTTVIAVVVMVVNCNNVVRKLAHLIFFIDQPPCVRLRRDNDYIDVVMLVNCNDVVLKLAYLTFFIDQLPCVLHLLYRWSPLQIMHLQCTHGISRSRQCRGLSDLS